MKIRDIIKEMDSNSRKSMDAALSAIDAVLSKNPNIDRRSPEQRKKDRDEMLAKRQAKRDTDAAEKDTQNKEEQEKIIAFAKKHGYDLEPQDIGYFKKGVGDGKRGSVDRGAGEAYGPHFGAYYRGTQIGRKIKDQGEGLGEATTGATVSSNFGTVEAPHISPGTARGKESYLGKPGSHGGDKAPPQKKVKQPKNPDGTAKAAHEIKSTSVFGGPAVVRR